ncbi:hypothetical protein AQ834_19685 [Burkholderia pseudomallei]|nr:hypothetical protein AQ823_05350 [Burkholderia pseudomallei]OMX83945.1 hypothetical protein AQ834_19685 [Burkholderia pseudomallei]
MRLPRHGGTIARMLEPPNTARPMLRRADVRRDSRFGGLAARFRRIAVSPYRHVADSTPAVRRARNMAAHRAQPGVAAEQRDTLDTPRA